MMTINAELTFEQAEEIALEFNYICEKEVKVDVIEELYQRRMIRKRQKVSDLRVVLVMGHIDKSEKTPYWMLFVQLT